MIDGNLTFEDYQDATNTTAIYPGHGTGSQMAVSYLALGLGEAGEVQGKIKKWLRDSHIDKVEVCAELGDLLWYVARIADELDISLEHIARANISKLADRKTRGTLQGNGDNR